MKIKDEELDLLYSELITIGFRVTSIKKKEGLADIEETLVKALYQVDHDSRMLGLIFSWLKVHHKHVIADKFVRTYNEAKKYLGDCPWFYASCAFVNDLKDFRFKKGLIGLGTSKFVGDRDQSAMIGMRGAIGFLEELNIMVPKGNIRIRIQDVLTTEELVKLNTQYRNRLIFGSNWRSEIITSVMKAPRNANQIAKELGIGRARVAIVLSEYAAIKNHLMNGIG